MNDNLAAFAQAAQSRAPSAPPIQGPLPVPQGTPQGVPQMGLQGGAPMSPPGGPQMPPGPPQGQQAAPQTPGGGRFTPQELAALGRMGDTLVAHLTPGEIEVPPQVQSPEVLATLKQGFKDKGVDMGQFTAGSPQSSINPQSGIPEYSFWAALLPILGAVAGSAIPGIGTAAGAALGGAAGGAVGGGIDHGWSGALRGAVLGGAGGYVGGSAFGGAADAAGGAAASGAADSAANAGLVSGFDAATAGAGTAAQAGSAFAPVVASDLAASGAASGLAGVAPAATGLASGVGSTAPGYLGQFANWVKANPVKAGTLALGAAQVLPSLFRKSSGTPPLPASMTMHMPAVNSVGNFNQQLGNSNTVAPHFNGYDQHISATSQPYNFFAPQG